MEEKNDVLNFDLSAKQIKYRDILNKEFIELEVYAISDINPNRNGSHFTLESMQKALPNIKNKPIVGFFENNDFTTHEGKADYDIETQKEFWNTEKGERILGWVRESDPVEIVEENNLHWIKFGCILCTAYCYKQVLRLLKDKRKKVSVEITVHDSENVNGIEYIKDFSLNGVTILGSKRGKAVLEGIPGAHLSVMDVVDDENLQEQKKMLAFAYQKYENSDNASETYNIVKENTNFDGENTKKEVNQANMDNVEIFAATIKVDKSKEAMSDTPWGDVDKAELRRKVVEADNFKSIAGDIFLDLREGWEDGEVSKLKYPVMELKDDTAVYNRGALGSAKAYAEQHDETEVLEKLKKIYEDLDLVDDEKYAFCDGCEEDYCDGCDGCDGEKGVDDKGADEGTPEEHGAHCDADGDDSVEITEQEPDVVIVEQNPAVINEGETELAMGEGTEADAVIVDNRMPTEMVPEEGMEIVVANDEKTEVVKIVDEEGKKADGADKVDDLSIWIEQLEAAKAKYCDLEKIVAEKDEIIKDYEAKLEKCCDYEEIKDKLAKAEEKLEAYRCADLREVACKLMECEKIKDEFYKDIISKCEKGDYACEEDIKKDVAFAIYSSRQPQEKRFSTDIPSIEINNKPERARKQTISAAEGIQNYLKK